MQSRANLPSRSVRQAYDYVCPKAPEYYEEFIRSIRTTRCATHPRAAL
jgi:hypothetical protein